MLWAGEAQAEEAGSSKQMSFRLSVTLLKIACFFIFLFLFGGKPHGEVAFRYSLSLRKAGVGIKSHKFDEWLTLDEVLRRPAASL